ncbi:replication restart helicase PriA [Rhodoferax saidenbachensis]|uniref:Replication restart protein PriA n=1 Tax=Rhodoferax saidenbachensis TaxID=1484693 RepID=A0A1P8K6C7_9BURK|nr:primosomal protein N' [Rhodoferax saidenbachensis]APW41539.1 primosomal protein N' [Rhodoferax saidenbachensis]
MAHWLSILVQTPAHARLGPVLTYQSEQPRPAGTLVRVPLGTRETLGVVWNGSAIDATGEIDPDKIRAVAGVLEGIAPLNAAWQQLLSFAASYYQRSVGEVALAALPPQLRELNPKQMERRLKRPKAAAGPDATAAPLSAIPALTPEQASAVAQIETYSGPFLLYGATGSGKTEVYLHCVQTLLEQDPDAQALVMVPEINLTPQLEARFIERFAPIYGAQAVVSMHSGMTNPQRLKAWLAAHSGGARIVLGTRMAVFASLPKLKLIVVDEEHDPSYKSSEGARYSARDLAIYRGRLESAKVILGSATPSLESWHQSRPAEEGGRYLRLHMPSRIGQTGKLPLVRRVDMNHQPRKAVFSLPLIDAIKERVLRGEQCLVFLNRRGYAPVLHCAECDWKSACPHCSAFRVFHKIDRTLRCHHCGFTERVPRACPSCGNVDIGTLGRGTEQLEEHLAELLADVRRPNTVSDAFPEGEPLRIARIDADTTRLKGALEEQLAAVHAGEVDVLVGTQMIAKGHDFRRITLVAAVNPDGALFSSDFRAPERLFSLLMQAAGRSGRDAALGAQSEVWVQTFQPAHPLYAALKTYDYPAFAKQQLKEREQAAMPPFSAQALVRADARTQEAAQAFLNAARQSAQTDMAQWEGWAPLLEQITLYPAVPMSIQRVANVERAQMLVESPSRAALQQFLEAWQSVLHATRGLPECKGLIRWAIDVDPLAI